MDYWRSMSSTVPPVDPAAPGFFRANISTWMVWLGRTVAGFTCSVLLGAIGYVSGLVINLILGYPWDRDVHINLTMVCIGLGAGVGAYLGWISLRWSRYSAIGVLALVCAVSVAGVYVGLAYGPGIDPTYWFSRWALDPYVVVISAVMGTAAATAVGLFQQWYYLKRDQSRPSRQAMTTVGSAGPDQEGASSD